MFCSLIAGRTFLRKQFRRGISIFCAAARPKRWPRSFATTRWIFAVSHRWLCASARFSRIRKGANAAPANSSAFRACCNGAETALRRTHLSEELWMKDCPKPPSRWPKENWRFWPSAGAIIELSNALWEKLLGDSAEGLKAYEQLAIYYEHHASHAAESRGALPRSSGQGCRKHSTPVACRRTNISNGMQASSIA